LEKDVFQNYSSLPENTFLQRFFIFNECFWQKWPSSFYLITIIPSTSILS
jgi:hypothetical protein